MKPSNIDIYYEVHGSGPPIVLIAGYTCDHTFWDAMVPHLADQFQVVTFDNRGVGRTKDDGKPFTVADMAVDTAALIQRLKLDRPAIVGQSMGGTIAQTVLVQFPELCGRCVILNSAAVFRRAALMALENLLALRKAGADFDLLVDATLPWVAGSDWLAQPENIATFKTALKQNPVPQSAADQERQLAALMKFDARSWNKPWREPALVVSAAEDVLALPTEGKALAKSLGAKYVEIPGGHGSPIEQPQRLARLLMKFLQNASSG
ncbi:lipolytic protein [Brucella endophytica]|uniref:Lipolytic protein n=1 Tax=Brucella endophytica TaxID=1963359 RepID=A0A916S1B8_9HYPH|nr:alpha/beta hydrolase [Brucella endophytica]GGA80006.1 lipolytic protein [Brucella endophytica]